MIMCKLGTVGWVVGFRNKPTSNELIIEIILEAFFVIADRLYKFSVFLLILINIDIVDSTKEERKRKTSFNVVF